MDSTRPGPLPLGSTFLGKYEIRALLGKGGHAFVYEAYDPFLDRVVAIKVIKSPEDVGRDLGKRARAEAQVLSRVHHKNLVRVLDAGIFEGLVYLIMEKLVGRTLRDTLVGLHRLSVAETLVVGLQVAEGMEVAHREQVIHRDLKPENIFIEAGNALKVLDFGIAKVLGMAGHRPETTERDLLQGTVLYMSPEHLQGFGVTPKSDIYSLGLILFEALYTHPLAVGEKPAGLQEAAWMQIARMPPMLDELDPSIPRFVSRLIHRAIVKLPEQRYPSMREFREALSAAVTRLQEEAKANPALFTLRDLSSRQHDIALNAPAHRTEPPAVSTHQVTVKAPYMGGDTEPLAPKHSEKPTVLALPRASSPPNSLPPTSAHLAEQPTNTAPALDGNARNAKSIPPNTAPPVYSGVAATPLRIPGPLLKDRRLRVAAIAAIAVGLLGGITYGVVTTSVAPASNASVDGAAIGVPPIITQVAAAPAEPIPVVPMPEPAATGLAVASAPVLVPSSPASGAVPLAPAGPAPKPASSAKTLSAKADAELQERLDWLDRDAKSKAGSAATKPATTVAKPATTVAKPAAKPASKPVRQSLF